MFVLTDAIKNAASDAVVLVKEILSLKDNLIQNPSTETERNNNISVNSDIRDKQKILKEKNIILRSNKLSPLLLSQVELDDDGNIIAPWEFSDIIDGTRQYKTKNTQYENATITNNEKNIQDQQNSLKSQVGNLNTSDIINSLNDISRLSGLTEILSDEAQKAEFYQKFRKGLEDDIRKQNKNILNTLSEIQSISTQISQTTDETELEVLLNNLQEKQNEYEEYKVEKEKTENVLNEFLNTSEGQKTRVSTEDDKTLSNISSDEKIAVNTLRKQYIDTINTTTSQEEREDAFQDIRDLDRAIKTNNIERNNLGSPDLTEIQDYNNQMEALIQERNELQTQLKNTESSDIVEIARLELKLKENSEDRFKLSKGIIGLQDNLGYGIKVDVETDESGKPKLIIYNVEKANYEVDEVYYTDLVGDNSVIKETLGTLNDQQYEMLKFVTATKVYDSIKGKIIPRPLGESGQESRYTNIRPNLPDSQEFADSNGNTPLDNYKNYIENELDKLQQDYEDSREYQIFTKLIDKMNDYVYETYVKDTDDKIFNNLQDMKKTLIEIGISEDVAVSFTTLSNKISKEDFVDTIYDVIDKNNITDEEKKKIDKLNELQIENTQLNENVNKYRAADVGIIDFGENFGQVYAFDASGNELTDVLNDLKTQTFTITIGE